MPAAPASRSRSNGARRAAPKTQDPQDQPHKARPEDYGEASERLVSRIAQQAAPRVATLIGKPPTFLARSPGQVAAGVSVPMDDAGRSGDGDGDGGRLVRHAAAHVDPAVAAAGSARQGDGGAGDRRAVRRQSPAASPACAARWARARSWSMDAAGADIFTVIGNVKLTAIDDAARPARHQMAGQGPERPQCRRPRTVQSRAARRDQG